MGTKLLVEELFFIILALFCLVIGLIIIRISTKNYPIREINLIFVTGILFVFMYIFYSINPLTSSPNELFSAQHLFEGYSEI
jgi:hypothetical protein